MSEADAKKIIEEITKKYFKKEARYWWDILEPYSDSIDPPYWNIFTLKGFTKDEMYMLGLALTELATKDE